MMFLLAMGLIQCKDESSNFSIENLNAQLLEAQGGDTLFIPEGEYRDVSLHFHANGKENQPVVLYVSHPAKTRFLGNSKVYLSGSYGVLYGMHFEKGATEETPIISFKKENGNETANHFRVTQCAISDYSNADRILSDHWVVMAGNHNRFDHNYVGSKLNLGTTLIMDLDNEESINNFNLIDSNYFAPKPRMGSNGGETIRIGSSAHSLKPGKATLLHNYFDKCSGEVEIVSIKSSENTIKGNVFFECEGVLAMRHGNGNIVSENYFIGNNKAATGGIRVINAGHRIFNNYFSQLKGERFFAAIAVMNGVPNSAINRYHQVKEVHIEKNVFVNCKQIAFGIGSDNERTAVPLHSKFNDNLIYSDSADWMPEFLVDVSGIEFSNNVSNTKGISLAGFVNENLIPQNSNENLIGFENRFSPEIPIHKEQTGPTWMLSKEKEATSSYRAKVLHLSPSNLKTVLDEIIASEGGDTIWIDETATYTLEQPIIIDKDLVILSKKMGAYSIFQPADNFKGSCLFQIQNGAKLSIKGIWLKGRNESANASFGIQAKAPMLKQYRLRVEDCRFSDFKESRFAGIYADKGTFADSITVLNSWFKDFSGLGVALNSENDDAGRYNAEFVTIKSCVFVDIMGTAIDVYRGGNDESTLGPFVQLENCTFINVCNRELGTAVRLIGAQFAEIDHCDFIDSGKSGRAIWFEDPFWANIRIQNIYLSNSGRIQTFYPHRVMTETIRTEELPVDTVALENWTL